MKLFFDLIHVIVASFILLAPLVLVLYAETVTSAAPSFYYFDRVVEPD